MSRNHFLFLFLCILIETATARSMIDCRVVTGDITECYPYGAKLLKAREIRYDLDRKVLIRVKNLPTLEKKSFISVISVEDMLDKYARIEDPIRYKGSGKTSSSTLKEAVKKEIKGAQITNVLPSIEKKPEKTQIIYGTYIVTKGDSLSRLAKKFRLKRKELAKLNGLESKAKLYIGQKLKLPFEQKMVEALVSAEYKVETGDTLIGIGKKFNLDPKALVQFNGIKSNTTIRTGKIIKLPLPYVLAKKKKKKLVLQRKSGKVNLLRELGKNKLRVTATAYSSHAGQTDDTPFLAAWNNRLRPGMKIIAVSRDMLTRYGMRNGTKVRIGGLPGYYRVRDKMNKRYKKRIDIYTGLDRRKALRWGKRSVVIYW